ncbi:hypothetical protein SPRG_00454 [Saprolegnia parasitica CBS 223.65]|uniref:Putative auto-transporter adhesin head GIN domain-containing protein n=1 Tax=Saprolegnia parasitica (strain CBS 223.65) TaxID=695850 RepID=A0A067D295_SAPPC|nr:hypothetical protein SPRG_00454 [Saprolegnia parasitica CBS 223.65]KDO35610.1 hypothetical protein SPRG_00454 [Saprolegnia parasitica CBS 223.65]|eukprot:XP_012193938.1 hypothetical protein SPRG_00454 [Saprolegnia parasitica CBS 223.65]
MGSSAPAATPPPPVADAASQKKVLTFNETHVHALREGVSGSKVFVSTHSEKHTTVVLTGAPADLEAIKAQVHMYKLGSRVLDLSRDAATVMEGRVLMEIFLDEGQPLRAVESVGSSELVLEDGTLAHHATVEKIGSGAIFVHCTKDVVLQQLHTVLRGSGLIQVDAPNLTLHAGLQVDVVGSGSTRFHTLHLRAPTVATKVTGSGDILLHATHLGADKLMSMVTGSGGIRYYEAGVVGEHIIDVSGSGKVLATSLLAERVLASVVGSGEVLTQATKALDGTVFGSGAIAACDPWPEHVAVSPRLTTTSHVPKSWTPRALPTRDLKLGIRKQLNLFGNTISINLDL